MYPHGQTPRLTMEGPQDPHGWTSRSQSRQNPRLSTMNPKTPIDEPQDPCGQTPTPPWTTPKTPWRNPKIPQNGPQGPTPAEDTHSAPHFLACCALELSCPPPRRLPPGPSFFNFGSHVLLATEETLNHSPEQMHGRQHPDLLQSGEGGSLPSGLPF